MIYSPLITLRENIGRRRVNLYSDFTVSPLPRVVRIEPASKCNLSCTHCPTNKSSNKGIIMAMNTFNKICHELKKCRIDTAVLYHGGEPFLNENIFEMSNKLYMLGADKIKVNTNGSLLNEIMPKLLKRGKITDLYISVDGETKKEYEKIRPGMNYNNLRKSIDTLIQNNGRLKIVIANTQIAKKPELAPPKVPVFIDRIATAKANIKTGWAQKWPGYKLKRGETVYNPNKDKKQYKHGGICDNIMETITIRANGDIVPCCHDITSEYIIGNILTENIDNIWNNERYRKLRREIYFYMYPELCKHCHVLNPGIMLIRGNIFKEEADGHDL